VFSPKKNMAMSKRIKNGRRQKKRSNPGPLALSVGNTNGFTGYLKLATRDFLNTVLSTTSNAGADVVTAVPVNISAASPFSVKMSDAGGEFLQWRMKRCVVEFVSVLSSTSYGVFIMGHTPDPYMPAPTTCQKISQLTGAQFTQIYFKNRLVIKMKNWLWCSTDAIDLRLSQLGFVYAGTVSTSAAQFPGFCTIDFVCEFRGNKNL